MKKYFSVFFAVILAICLVSFSTQGKTAKATQDLYWFEVNNGVVGDQIGEGGAISREAAISESCPDVSGVDCARGYASPDNPGSPNNQALDQIQKAE